MALYLLQPGLNPLGQFDFLDTQLTSVTGGELGTFAVADANQFHQNAIMESFGTVTSDNAASDVYQDGYVPSSSFADGYRPVVRLANQTTETGPLYLLDDGTTGYGTLFGQVIGTPVGLTFTGTNLGPHTAAASGKVTLWDKPGLYAVSTASVSTTLASSVTALPGSLLYREAGTGKLTTSAATTTPVAVFVEFSTNGSLVTSPAKLVGGSAVYDRVVVQFLGA